MPVKMVEKRLTFSGIKGTNAFIAAAWVLVAANIMGCSGEMSNEVDSDLSSSMSLGVVGNELTLGQDGIGNNTITAVRPGEAARLACPIPAEMFGTRVSWIRRADLQILSVGESLYLNDQRLFVSHSRHSRNSHHSQVWFLHLMNVTKRDEGEYECQMSTHPHVSIFTFLKVQNAYSRVEGPEERVVASGSDLRLVCIIEGASSKPSHVFWYQYDRMVNYDAARGITVTQSSPMRSTLAIAEVTADHAGNYTCQPSNAVPASVNVHVVAETTEPSATGRVGKKVAEKTPVRQLGVKSASSGGPALMSPTVPLTFLGFLVLHILVVPGLLAFSTQAVKASIPAVLSFPASARTPKTAQRFPSRFQNGFQPSKRGELAFPRDMSCASCCCCCSSCCLKGAQSPSGLPK